jgi:hypothetical protein
MVISIPPELAEAFRRVANVQGKTVEQVGIEALRKAVESPLQVGRQAISLRGSVLAFHHPTRPTFP